MNSSTIKNDSQSFMVYFYPVFYGQNFQYVSIIVDLSTLQELSAEDRSAYILMQRIMPGLQTSVMTRQGQLKVLQGDFCNGAMVFASHSQPSICKERTRPDVDL